MADDNTSSPHLRERPEPAEDEFLLKPYKGERPPAPDWFNAMVATPCRTGHVSVEGADIAYKAWGDPSRRGLLLAHGNGAHAGWWDFIAPYFAEEFHVVAPDFSGMGDSDWRETYSFRTYSAEQLAVSEAAGLFAGPEKPLIVAHSFGGFVSLGTAIRHGKHFAGTVVVDSQIRPPSKDGPRPPERTRPNRVYPDVETALARYRLAPPQPCDNHYAVDYIARHSLRETVDETGRPGVVWKFDPFIFRSLIAEWDGLDLTRLETAGPLAFMRGEHSSLVTPETSAYMQELRDPAIPMITIPGAHHHVMLDQPLAFVSAVRGLLAAWP